MQYDFDPLNDSGGGGTGKTYQVFVLELSGRNVDAVLGSSAVYSGNSLQHRFHFTDGVLINPNVRIGIGLHRTDGGNNEGLSVRAGAESQNSPRESYDDASEDFNFLGRFNHDRPTPSVNDTVGGTAANQIYGNPEIFYQIIHTHASLVGDGTVSSSHISSGSAAADAALLADGSGGTGFRAVVVHGNNIVDNTIPTDKYGNNTVTEAKIADSIVEKLCPDPSTGSSGQVCARNSAGDGYELVTASGGGGSGSGNPNATRIVTGATYDAGTGGNETIEAPGWRSCDMLQPVFHDSSESAAANANSNRPDHGVDMFFASALDTDGSLYVGVSQNEGVRVLRAADNDFLTFQWVGTSPAPGSSDTLDIWCLDAGGSPGGEAEDTTVSANTDMFDETTIDVPSGTWGYVNFGISESTGSGSGTASSSRT